MIRNEIKTLQDVADRLDQMELFDQMTGANVRDLKLDIEIALRRQADASAARSERRHVA